MSSPQGSFTIFSILFSHLNPVFFFSVEWMNGWNTLFQCQRVFSCKKNQIGCTTYWKLWRPSFICAWFWLSWRPSPYRVHSQETRTRTLCKSLPGNHAQFQQFAKILKMFFEAYNDVKGKFQVKNNNFTKLTVGNKKLEVNSLNSSLRLFRATLYSTLYFNWFLFIWL